MCGSETAGHAQRCFQNLDLLTIPTVPEIPNSANSYNSPNFTILQLHKFLQFPQFQKFQILQFCKFLQFPQFQKIQILQFCKFLQFSQFQKFQNSAIAQIPKTPEILNFTHSQNSPIFSIIYIAPPAFSAPSPSPPPQENQPHRSGRTTKPPGQWRKVPPLPSAPVEGDLDEDENDHYQEVHFAGATSTTDPCNYKQAMKGDNANKWQNAINAEYNTLLQHGTWELCELPPDAKGNWVRLGF